MIENIIDPIDDILDVYGMYGPWAPLDATGVANRIYATIFGKEVSLIFYPKSVSNVMKRNISG